MLLAVIKYTIWQFFLQVLNLKGHQKWITGSRVAAILLNGWIFPIGQSGEASRWRVCYQWGLPRLAFKLPGLLLNAKNTWKGCCLLPKGQQKSRIRETKHLSTDADSSTDAIGGWTKNTPKPALKISAEVLRRTFYYSKYVKVEPILIYDHTTSRSQPLSSPPGPDLS